MKLATSTLLQDRSTPQEVRKMRQSTYDYYSKMGEPIVLKHRWNFKDFRAGLCQKCPFHNEAYNRDITSCDYCFGTGFLGGFADGIVTFCTLNDAPADVLSVSERGILTFQAERQVSFPWFPIIGDTDFVIAAEFDFDDWTILEVKDIYELSDATPSTMRGFPSKDPSGFLIEQVATVHKLPYAHRYFDVPIEFDYKNAPDTPLPAEGADLDGFDTMEGMRNSISVGLKTTGTLPTGRSSTTSDIATSGVGNTASVEHGIVASGVVGARVIF